MAAQQYSKFFLFNIRVPGTLHPQIFMKSNYKIDEATRNKLYKKEQWHFTVVQLGWFTIGVFLTSLWELMIFA